MKRKNFTATPNTFLLDENKSHDVTKLLKNATEKLIVIIMEGLQAKFGREFQKSSKQIANMCLIARSTFITNVDNLINKGVISKRVEKIEGSKESETTYWTVNIELLHDIEVIPNSDKVESELGQGLSQNDIGVIPNSDKGCPNIGQKEDIKDFKDLELKKEEEEYIYNNPIFDHFYNLQENKGIATILDKKGFSHDTIMSIRKLCAEQKIHNELKPYVIELAIENYYKDKANGLEIKVPANFFVYKLKDAGQKILERAYINEQHEKSLKEKEQKAAAGNPLPFYNWLEN